MPMMNAIIVPVVVGPLMTQRAIESAAAQDIRDGVTVLALDNGSRDGTSFTLRTLPCVVRTYPVQQSLNKVWNDALSWAFDQEQLDRVLVINNDVKLRPDTYRLLARDSGSFVTGVSVSEEEQTRHVHPSSRSPHPCFSCFLMRKDVWQKVGRFDERYWAFASDGDYHLRMDRAGIDAYAIDVPFLHLGSGTMKALRNEERDELQRRADADRALFHQQYGFEIGSEAYYKAFRHERDNRYATTGRL